VNVGGVALVLNGQILIPGVGGVGGLDAYRLPLKG
jgi:hypothetical protein